MNMKTSANIKAFFLGLEEKIATILWPQGASCQVCGEKRKVHEKYALCDACRALIEKQAVPAEACSKCLFPVRRTGCAMCVSGRMNAIDRSYAPFRYREQVRKLIHEFKFEHNASFLPYIADAMADTLTDREYDILVPVPLSEKRMLERRRNQARMLAEALSARTDIPVRDALMRIGYQKPQSETPLQDRQKNVSDCFRCCDDVQGKKVLLIDDVRTTGSTAQACAMELKKAGAVWVGLCTAAVVYRNPRKLKSRVLKKKKRFHRK